MITRKELIRQAKKSCKYQQDLSCDAIKRYIRCFEYVEMSGITVDTVEEMGRIISSKNKGFRNTPVTFRDGNVGLKASQIIRSLTNLIDASYSNNVSPSEFFIEFEKIHPYNDGNGRVGEILYYCMTESFNCPHEYFKDK